MPRFDGTGPAGMGPATGRGAGYCCFGLRRGVGLCRYFNTGAKQDVDKKELEDYKKALEEELKEVEDELNKQ